MRKIGMIGHLHPSGLAMGAVLAAAAAAATAPAPEIASAGRHRGREPRMKPQNVGKTELGRGALNKQRC